MGECGCSGNPDQAFVIQTKAGEYVLIGIWDRTCPGCGTEPMVMAGAISKEDYEDFWKEAAGVKLYKSPEMYADAFVPLDRIPKLEKALDVTLDHVLDEHVHDREECAKFFTKRGKPLAIWKKLDKEIRPGYSGV